MRFSSANFANPRPAGQRRGARKNRGGEAADAARERALKAAQQEALRSAAAFIADREAADAAPAAPVLGKEASATTVKKTEKSKVGP